MTTVTADRLRDRLDNGDTITLVHDDPKHGGTARTYTAHPDGGYEIRRVTHGDQGERDVGTMRVGPKEVHGHLGLDLLNGWTEGTIWRHSARISRTPPSGLKVAVEMWDLYEESPGPGVDEASAEHQVDLADLDEETADRMLADLGYTRLGPWRKSIALWDAASKAMVSRFWTATVKPEVGHS